MTHLGINSTEMHTCVNQKTCKRMFIAALFIIAPSGNPKCLSTVELINHGIIHKMEFSNENKQTTATCNDVVEFHKCNLRESSQREYLLL